MRMTIEELDVPADQLTDVMGDLYDNGHDVRFIVPLLSCMLKDGSGSKVTIYRVIYKPGGGEG